MGVFVGRSSELDRLVRLVERRDPDLPQIAVVSGEAGIGKTRLLDQALAEGTRPRSHVLRGRCGELENRRPFGAIADCLGIDRRAAESKRASIARSLWGNNGETHTPSLLSLAPEAEYRIVEEMVTLVEELSRSEPVVIVVEDLQWADPSTILVLRRLARYIEQLNLIMITSLRPRPRSPELGNLLEALSASRTLAIELTPLNAEDVATLVRDLVHAEPGIKLMEQVRTAAGNPLFVTELVTALDREGAIEMGPGGEADVKQVALPTSLPLTILHRLSFLPAQTLEVLRLASVLGSSFDARDLATVMGRSAVELLGHLRESIDSGLLHEMEGSLAFRHDLIRESLYSDIPPPLRASLHLEVARSLAAVDSAPEQVAEHFVRGAKRGDREAVAWLHRAGRRVASGAPGVAIDLFQKAIELCPPSDRRADGLIAECAVSLMWSGRLEEAEAMCEEVLGRNHDPAVEGLAHWCLVQTLLARGRPQEAVKAVEDALRSPAISESDAVRLRARGSMAQMLSGDLGGAAIAAKEVEGDAKSIGDEPAVCIATMVSALTAYFAGRFTDAADLGSRAIALADHSKNREAHFAPLHLYFGLILMDLDRFEEADAHFRRGREISEELGGRWNVPIYHWASTRFWSGQWDDAIADFKTGLTLSEETGTRHGLVVAWSVRGLIALHRNDLATAEASLAKAESEFARTGPQYRFHWLMWAQALLREKAGDSASAAALLSGAWDICTATQMVAEYPVIGPDLVRLLIATGDTTRAKSVAGSVEKVCRGTEAPWLAGAAARCRGLATADAGVLGEAVEHYRASHRPRELALTCEEAGLALATGGDVAAGRLLLEEATEIYGRLEARGDTDRLQSRCAALGLPRRRSPERPTFGWDSLTQTEARVAALVAEGLSNPQVAHRLFVSPRTVQTHVSHIFTKLGISSRVDLARLAAQRDSTLNASVR